MCQFPLRSKIPEQHQPRCYSGTFSIFSQSSIVISAPSFKEYTKRSSLWTEMRSEMHYFCYKRFNVSTNEPLHNKRLTISVVSLFFCPFQGFFDVFQFSSSLISFVLLPIYACLFLSFWTVILSVTIKITLFQTVFALSKHRRYPPTVGVDGGTNCLIQIIN